MTITETLQRKTIIIWKSLKTIIKKCKQTLNIDKHAIYYKRYATFSTHVRRGEQRQSVSRQHCSHAALTRAATRVGVDRFVINNIMFSSLSTE